jgi:hypothetical protein
MDRVIETMRGLPGFLAIRRQQVLEDPDRLIEIAECESPGARQTWVMRSMGSGTLDPLMEILGPPFRATNVR